MTKIPVIKTILIYGAIIIAFNLAPRTYAENPIKEVERVQKLIPKSYGRLVNAHKSDYREILWLEAKDGTIRRVEIAYIADDREAMIVAVDVYPRN
ncbi:MAG: hypothetical protein HQ579_01345 [Candidatus Omnitrophica bacterium]|nr:hypothetical protein [Candidatus Omnitrophota bacterium]